MLPVVANFPTSIPDAAESTLAGQSIARTELKKPRSGKRAIVERSADDVLSTLKFTAIAEWRAHSVGSAESALDVDLGIAFVAGALGKKVPAVFSQPALLGILDCYVELASTRKKSKAVVSVAPPNSVDSEDLGMFDELSGGRLSQSDVHVGYPEERIETETDVNSRPIAEVAMVSSVLKRSETFAVDSAMLDVAAVEEVGDEPPILGEGPKGMSCGINTDEVEGGKVNTPRIPLGGRLVPRSEEEKVAMRNKYDDRQRAIKEIAVSELLQEELAKSNPNLVSVFAFMNKVCGTGSEARKLKETCPQYRKER